MHFAKNVVDQDITRLTRSDVSVHHSRLKVVQLDLELGLGQNELQQVLFQMRPKPQLHLTRPLRVELVLVDRRVLVLDQRIPQVLDAHVGRR